MLTVFLGRLLKHLAAMGTIYETGSNEYVSTPLSKALREPIYRDAYPTMFVSPLHVLLDPQFKSRQLC